MTIEREPLLSTRVSSLQSYLLLLRETIKARELSENAPRFSRSVVGLALEDDVEHGVQSLCQPLNLRQMCQICFHTVMLVKLRLHSVLSHGLAKPVCFLNSLSGPGRA